MTFFSTFKIILRYEMRLYFHRIDSITLPIAFFIMVTTLFPLAIDPSPEFLRTVAPGLIWIAITLALLMTLDQVFSVDYRNGTLEQMRLSQQFGLIIVTKLLVFWIGHIVPLILLAPGMALILSLPTNQIPSLIFTLVLGTGGMALIGVMIAGLLVGIGKKNMILPLLLLPLYAPFLILGANCLQSDLIYDNSEESILYLASLFVLALTLCPLAIIKALEFALEENQD